MNAQLNRNAHCLGTPQGHVVHLWLLENLADLEQHHAALAGDPDFTKCALEISAPVFRASLDYHELAKILRLGPGQFVAFAQTVGYPA